MDHPPLKRLRYLAEYAGARGFHAAARRLPESWVEAVGAGIGDAVYAALRVRRDVVLSNLRQASLPGLDGNAESIARATYRHFSRVLIEFARLPQQARVVEFSTTGPFDRAIARGRGAVILSAHLGNWELLGSAIAQRGYPTHVVVARHHNPHVGALMDRIRRAGGMKPVPAGAGTSEIVRVLRRNEFIGLVADQHAGDSGVRLEFLGRPVMAWTGPARLALRFDAPIILCFTYRTSGGGYRAEIEELPLQPSSDETDPVRWITQQYLVRLEAAIARRPDHWLWLHRRWRDSGA